MQSYNISQGKYDKILLSKCWCIALYQPIFLMSLYELSMVMVQKLWADIALVIIKFAILLMIDSIANNWKQKNLYNTVLNNFVITSYSKFERLFYKSIKF